MIILLALTLHMTPALHLGNVLHCWGYLECGCRKLGDKVELVFSEVQLLQYRHARQFGREVTELVTAAVQHFNICHISHNNMLLLST